MSSSPANVKLSSGEEARLRSYLEAKGLEFHIRTGNSKWKCTLTDRATHEKKKAVLERESSSGSVDTLATFSSTSSSSSSSSSSSTSTKSSY